MKKSMIIIIAVVVILILLIGSFMIFRTKPKDLESQQGTNINQQNSDAPVVSTDETILSTAADSIDTPEFLDSSLDDLG